ncbi:MAG: response regulator [Nitrospirota bacterium]
MKILIIEDEESVRLALSKILENFGYNIFTAADGPEGLELFVRQGDFDLVVTDLSLPGPSGWEVASSVKEREPKTPVILLSGWDVTDSELRSRGNIERVLSKPVKISSLLQAISELVIKREA